MSKYTKGENMYWADKFAEEIVSSGGYKPYWVDDMKTPSGRVHIGSVRAVLTHEIIFRALKDKGVEVNFSYVLEDQDPFDKIPSYLNEDDYKEHLGKPLYKVPFHEKGYDSYGQRWGQEYIEIFNAVGAHPKVIWGSELYKSGQMNKAVRICLDNADKISDIYKELYGEAKPKGWYPINLACEKCGKIATTTVTDWDGKNVTYACNITDSYTPSCGHTGEMPPFDGNAKLPWKVEWPCKWMAIGVTIEGAGKDHMSDGGSHDFAKFMCERVLKYPIPFHFSHEFFLIGGHKMSSSKGVGSSAKEISEIIPPFLIRFAIARVRYSRAINFDPNGDTIPDLYDAFDQASQAYWDKSDDRLARIFEMSQLNRAPKTSFYLPRFREIIKVLQDPKLNLEEYFSKQKGEDLSNKDRKILHDREKYARLWIKEYAPRDMVFDILLETPEETNNLTEEQKKYLSAILPLVEKKWNTPADLQQALYQASKDMGVGAKQAFQSIYISLLGKTHGPKAAWLIVENKDKVIERFKEIISTSK